MHLNIWGISKRLANLEEFDPDTYIFIERVRTHLDLTLIQIKGEGQPVQAALGEKNDDSDPDAATNRVTPFFSSLEALDYFCRLNLQRYLAFDPHHGLPRRWFWADSSDSR